MKTDALFYQLFARYPEAFFELQGQPGSVARLYDFASLELKETAQRIDGVFLPKTAGLPTYFVEVQFYRYPEIYANLLAKIYLYLKQNNPALDFRGVILFGSRSLEPRDLGPYQPLLDSGHVTRYFMDELEIAETMPLGLSVLQMVACTEDQAIVHGRHLIHRARREIDAPEEVQQLIQWIETVILCKLPMMNRKEIEAMFLVEDIRKSRVYQEALEEGREATLHEAIPVMLAEGLSESTIARYFRISAEDVRNFAKPKVAPD